MSKYARAFFFHFNKPASRQAGRPQISVHTKGKCLIVDNVIVDVPTRGRLSKRQPYFVMSGRGCVIIRNSAANPLEKVAHIAPDLRSWEYVLAV